MHKSLIIFVHGLGGDTSTWGDFPQLIREDAEISTRFEVADPYTYSTSARGKGPSIDQLALELASFLNLPDHAAYTELVLISHSMGGLVARRYIADELIAGHRLRATRLLTYATPHLGSQWASGGTYMPGTGPQMDDLAVGSLFMNRLGLDWARVHADRYVRVRHVVAGDDGAVALWSATAGFRNADFDVVRQKTHISIVKPTATDAAFQIARRFLLDDRPDQQALPNADWRQPLLNLRETAATHSNRFMFSARVTPFVGREREIQTLKEFLRPEVGAFGWMMVYGPGGVGKSRLALEMSRGLRATKGWYAGFLNERAEEPDWSRWQPAMPTAIIVDYAANEPERIDAMLGGLADRVSGQAAHPLHQPVRIVLIEREKNGEWLKNVVGVGATAVPVKETRWPDLELKTLADPWPIIKYVLEASAIPLPDCEETLQILAAIDHQSRPLFAYFMADALAAGRNVRSFDEQRLVEDVIDRERRNFWRPAGASPQDERALALATMTGGLPRAELSGAPGGLLPLWDIDRHPTIFGAMTGAIDAERIAPLEPDIVGEHFVAQVLNGQNLSEVDKILLCDIAWRVSTTRMGRFVVRAHVDLPQNRALPLLRTPPRQPDALKRWFASSCQIVSEIYHQDRVATEALIDDMCDRIEAAPFSILQNFILFADLCTPGQRDLCSAVYTVLITKPDSLIALASATPLDQLCGFLRSAPKYGQAVLAAKLYAALLNSRSGLTKILFASRLDQISGLLRTVVAQKQRDLLRAIYSSLISEPKRLADIVLRSELDHINSVVRTAETHKRLDLIESIYAGLAGSMDRLETIAFDTPVDKLPSFLRLLRKYKQITLLVAIYRSIAANAERWSPKLADLTPAEFNSFLWTIPRDYNELGVSIVACQKVEDWSFGDFRSSRFSVAAGGLAYTFARLGRQDLGTALARNLLRRRDLGDFSNASTGLLDMTRTLAIVYGGAEKHALDQFLNLITPDWLESCYLAPDEFVLQALDTLVHYMPPPVIVRFWGAGLDRFVARAVNCLRATDDVTLGKGIKAIGTGALMGRPASYLPSLRQIDLDRIGRLPSGVLRHAFRATQVDLWQRQLWFGLRFVSQQSSRRLVVELPVIERTLLLWRANLDRSSDPSQNAHWINKSMVRWLAASVEAGEGQLSRDDEPLWLLTGFPIDPKRVILK